MRPCISSVLLLLFCSPARAGEADTFRGKTFAEWRTLLHHPDAKARSRAAMALGLGPFGRPAVPELMRVLNDPSMEVRRSAVVALGHLGPTAEAAIPVLAAALAKKDDAEVLLLRTLIRIGPAAVPAWLADDYGERVDAVKTKLTPGIVVPPPLPPFSEKYGRPGVKAIEVARVGPALLPALIAALRDTDPGVRERAATSIAWLHADAAPAVPALVHALGDRSAAVRGEAADTLNLIGSRGKPAVPALRGLLTDSNKDVRQGALSALIQIDPSANLPMLIEHLRKQGRSAEVVGLLARNCTPSALNALRTLYRQHDPAGRAALLFELRSTGPSALPLLLEGMEDEEEVVRKAVVETLRELDADITPFLPWLIRTLDKAEEATAKAILQAIGRISPLPPEGLTALGKTLRHPQERVAIFAATQLEALAGLARPALPLILAGLRDHRPGVRAAVIGILNRIAPDEREVVHALCAALRDENDYVRESAAAALGSPGPAVREIASVRAPLPGGDMLGDIQGDMAAAALRVRLRDGSARVRIAAAEALWRVGLMETDVVDVLAWEVAGSANWFRAQNTRATQRATQVLKEMGKRATRAVPALMLSLWAEDKEQRHLTIATLRSIGPAAAPAVPSLRWIMRNEMGDAFPVEAAAALAALGVEGNTALREEFANWNLSISQVIALAGHEKGQLVPFLVPQLLCVLRQRDSDYHIYAAVALSRLHPAFPEVHEFLARALSSEDEAVRSKSCQALAQMGPAARSVIPAMCGLLLDRDPAVRRDAIRALQQIGPDLKVGLPALIESLTDPDSCVRHQAAEALGTMGASARPALAALRAAGRDREDDVRLAAALAVAQIEGRKDHTVRELKALMEQSESGLRVALAEALWRLDRRHEVVPALVRMVREDTERSAATEALRELHGKTADVAAFVRPLLRHKEYGVREAAQRILWNLPPRNAKAFIDFVF